MQNIKILLLFFVISYLMFVSCGAGGRCDYDKFEAYIIIDSVLVHEDYCINECKDLLYYEDCYNSCMNDFRVYFSVFNKSDNKKIYFCPQDTWYDFIDTNCISLNLFTIGDTLFNCEVDTITSGTCDPYILRIFDYPECFRYYGKR